MGGSTRNKTNPHGQAKRSKGLAKTYQTEMADEISTTSNNGHRTHSQTYPVLTLTARRRKTMAQHDSRGKPIMVKLSIYGGGQLGIKRWRLGLARMHAGRLMSVAMTAMDDGKATGEQGTRNSFPAVSHKL
ncbi:hypothetical protein V6N13_006032 [Hibiscus sabdariffa]